eukprot:gene15308-18137_t
MGSLATPYYVQALKRDYINYYLLVIEEASHLNLERVKSFLVSSNNAASDATVDWTPEDLVWCKPTALTPEFRTQTRLATPETRYMAGVLSLFERDSFDAVVPEKEGAIGVRVPLEYAPGIESIPIASNTLIPFASTNLVVCMDQGAALVVDPGASATGAPHLDAIIKNRLVDALDIKGANLSIFITHEHRDHWEGLPQLAAAFPEAKVIAHPDTLAMFETPLKKVPVLGKPLNGGADPVNTINVGSQAFEIIDTPGHTNNSLCLYHRSSRTLIAGDHIVGWGSSILDPKTGNMKDYLASTQGMIDHLEPKIAIPAHGPTSYDPLLLLQNYIKHRLSREKTILEAYKNGNTSLSDILKVVYTDIDPGLNEMAKNNIKLHLDKLKSDNQI